MAKYGAIGCIALIVVAAIVGLVVAGTYNSLNTLDQEVRAQWAQVENVYQRRADLIPNLVNTVKGAANFEQETLIRIAEARASVGKVQIDAKNLPNNPGAFAQFEQAQQGLSSALSRLMVVVERYPELKANANFRDLQAQLEGTENRIAVARNRYIDAVAEFNKLVRFFPTNLTARFILGVEPRPTFEATAGAEKPPEVKF